MKITSKDIEDSKQNRDKFNHYYNDAVIDVIALKEDCNMSIKEIENTTGYDIDFIIHVTENYMINSKNHLQNENENEIEYDLSVKVNKYHKNIEQIIEKYGEPMMEELLKEELKETYYYSK
jgi:hypothetical protein